MNARELKKMFPYLTNEKMRSLRSSYKTERGWLNHLKKINEESEQKCTAPFIYHLEIVITWRKSKTWGLCPSADAYWYGESGGNSAKGIAYASGCGYDKLSACLSSALNEILTRNLYEARNKVNKKRKENGQVPYGLERSDFDVKPYFVCGCGVLSTSRCVAYINGNIKHDVSTETMDRFVIDFKRPKK